MSEPANPKTSTESSKAGAEPSCEARLAAEAVRLAKAELQKAQAAYDKARRQAAERLKSIRETNLGDVVDKTLDTVKRHPALGLGVAALIGYYLGRLFGPRK
jgi:ElaB/YqjD/DUF883 family membrane-anchored ribosome-binding protein